MGASLLIWIFAITKYNNFLLANHNVWAELRKWKLEKTTQLLNSIALCQTFWFASERNFLLIYIMSLLFFYIRWKHQNASGFLMISGNTESMTSSMKWVISELNSLSLSLPFLVFLFSLSTLFSPFLLFSMRIMVLFCSVFTVLLGWRNICIRFWHQIHKMFYSWIWF